MLCIYCKERGANAREHYLPQCLGRFQKFEPLLHRLCQNCNEDISALEREFCRRSPEAIVRSVNWIKGQTRSRKKRQPAHIYQPEKIGGRHLYMYGPDPETGRDILWQTDTKPGAVKEISQFVLFDDLGEETNHIPIPTEIKSGRELVDLFRAEGVNFPVPKAQVIAASGDEDRIQAMCKELSWNVDLQRRTGGRVRRQFFKSGAPAWAGPNGEELGRGLAGVDTMKKFGGGSRPECQWCFQTRSKAWSQAPCIKQWFTVWDTTSD
jgi:hypothetical protein